MAPSRFPLGIGACTEVVEVDSVEKPPPAPEKVDLTLYNGILLEIGLAVEMVKEYESEQKGSTKRGSDKITSKAVHEIMTKVRKLATDEDLPLPAISSSSLSKPLSFTSLSGEANAPVASSSSHPVSSFMLDLPSLLNGSSLGLRSIRKPISEQEPVKTEPSPDEEISIPVEAKPAEPEQPLAPDASAPATTPATAAAAPATPMPVLRETPSELSSLIKEAEGESRPVVPKLEEEKAKQEEEKPKPQKARGHRVGGRCVVR